MQLPEQVPVLGIAIVMVKARLVSSWCASPLVVTTPCPNSLIPIQTFCPACHHLLAPPL